MKEYEKWYKSYIFIEQEYKTLNLTMQLLGSDLVSKYRQDYMYSEG